LRQNDMKGIPAYCTVNSSGSSEIVRNDLAVFLISSTISGFHDVFISQCG
jgi:hypothetical protein